MSGIVSGLSKVFTTVGSAAARVGRSILGVGSTVFTAGAATGAGPMATGGLSGIVQNLTGGGVLGNVLTGAIKQAGYGALIGGVAGMVTGQGFGKGALIGGLGGALMGGLSNSGLMAPAQGSGIVAADTPTGAAPTGITGPAPGSPAGGAMAASAYAPVNAAVTGTPAVAAAAPAAPGIGGFFQGETGAGLLKGLGQGLGAYMEAKALEDRAEADRQFLIDKEQRLRDSYSVDPSVLHSPMQPQTAAAQPAQTRREKAGRPRYRYDPEQARIVVG